MVRPVAVAGVASIICVAACSSSDPPVGVYQVNGRTAATAAYAGAGSLCCDQNGMANVAWQIWFTDTESCPADLTAAAATLFVIAPTKVTPPSTSLPDLGGSMELAIRTAPATVTTPIAVLHDIGTFAAPMGTLTLSSFDTETVAGSFSASASDQAGVAYTFAGSFTATACSTIHD